MPLAAPSCTAVFADFTQDIEGGAEPFYGDDPKAQPVLGFGFCSTKGRRVLWSEVSLGGGVILTDAVHDVRCAASQ